MARPNHAKAPQKKPQLRVWVIVALLAAGLLAIPATAQDAPTTCDYSQSHLHSGWGWDEETKKSCAPAQGDTTEPDLAGPNDVEPTNVEPVEDRSAEHNPVQPTASDVVMAESPTTTAAPMALLMVGTCDYSKSHHFDGYGWDETNGVACEPLLTTSTTEYIAPEPGSPEDTCDYSKSHLQDGYGWDKVNGIACLPMADRIAKAALKR